MAKNNSAYNWGYRNAAKCMADGGEVNAPVVKNAAKGGAVKPKKACK